MRRAPYDGRLFSVRFPTPTLFVSRTEPTAMKEVRMRNGDVVDAEDAPACKRCGDPLRTERGVRLCADCYDEVGNAD